MQLNTAISRILPLALLAAGMIGCAGESGPPTYKVSGVVTLDGQPVEGAVISFLDEKGGPYNAVATSGADGKYELTTFEKGDGAVEGKYNIMVTKYGKEDEVSPNKTPADAGGATVEEGNTEAYEDAYGEAMEGAAQGGWRPPKTWNDLPDKYANVGTSGLTYTVTSDQSEHTVDLTLVSK